MLWMTVSLCAGPGRRAYQLLGAEPHSAPASSVTAFSFTYLHTRMCSARHVGDLFGFLK